MVADQKLGKAVVLIDGGYLAKVLEKIFNKPPFDFEKFSDLLAKKLAAKE
jgi:hypothetical protein